MTISYTTKLGLSKAGALGDAAGTWHTLWNGDADALEARLANTYAGDPNGNVAGYWIGQQCYDTSNGILYICTTTGVAASAVWQVKQMHLGVSYDLTKGYTATPNDLGNTGTSSITPAFANGNTQKATVTGDFTLNDPTTGEGWMIIAFTNDGAGPHSPTFDGFSATLLPNSADWDATDSAENYVVIERRGTTSKYGIYNNA